jgi:hypothetical protein
MPPLSGDSASADVAGVVGTNVDGAGVWGESRKNRGVVGVAGEAGVGVWGHTKKGRGVVGVDDQDGAGVWGDCQKGRGVVGVAGEGGAGVWGHTKKGRGVVGVDDEDGTGVWGECQRGHGVVGVSGERGTGVSGRTRRGVGVAGVDEDDGTGVFGQSGRGIAVHGRGGRRAGFFEGDVEVTGDILLSGADCAEEFDVLAGTLVEPGTVVVVDDEGALRPSSEPYDKRVVGVISGAGAFRPGIVLDRRASSAMRQPIGLVGKVYCRVDAGYGPIEVGDLVTTSPTPGHAMRVADPLRAFGAVIGKALGRLEHGQGLVPMLIALQ